VELGLAAQLGVDELDRDLALQRLIDGLVDLGHAAAAAPLDQAVAVADDHGQLQFDAFGAARTGGLRRGADGGGRGRLGQRRGVVGAEARPCFELLTAGRTLVHETYPLFAAGSRANPKALGEKPGERFRQSVDATEVMILHQHRARAPMDAEWIACAVPADHESFAHLPAIGSTFHSELAMAFRQIIDPIHPLRSNRATTTYE